MRRGSLGTLNRLLDRYLQVRVMFIYRRVIEIASTLPSLSCDSTSEAQKKKLRKWEFSVTETSDSEPLTQPAFVTVTNLHINIQEVLYEEGQSWHS